MVFRNLEALGISSVSATIKVGDTASDILEGRNAGLISVGVIEGSSIMGLSQAEYEALPDSQKKVLRDKMRQRYLELGADYVINNMSELSGLISAIEKA